MQSVSDYNFAMELVVTSNRKESYKIKENGIDCHIVSDLCTGK